MKTIRELQEILKELKPILSDRFKVEKVGIFGSYLHENAYEESDIDILIEFSEPIGWEFFDLKDFLEDKLGKKVDLVTVPALKPPLRDEILKEVVYT